MDFQNYVTDYMAERGNEDPSFLFSDEGQQILDVSRRNDLDSRSEDIQRGSLPDESTEVTDVDELAQDESSLTGLSKQATESASSESIDATPAAEAEPDQPLITDSDPVGPVEIQFDRTEVPEPEAIITEEADPVLPDSPLVTSGESAEPEFTFTEDGEQAMPEQPLMEQSVTDEDAAPIELTEPAPEPGAESIPSNSSAPAQPDIPESGDGEPALPDESLVQQPEQPVAESEPIEATESNPAEPSEIVSEQASEPSPPPELIAAEVAPESSEPSSIESPLADLGPDMTQQHKLLVPEGREAEFNELFETAGEELRKQFEMGHEFVLRSVSFEALGFSLPELTPLPDYLFSRDSMFNIANSMQKFERQ